MNNRLFEPIRINGVEIKNRIAYPALGLLYSMDGKINDRYYNFFIERAKGGAGIVTVGPVGFNFVGSGPILMQIDDDDKIPSFEKLVKGIQNAGARAWIQIFHAGAYSYSKLLGGEDPVAPSAVYSRYSKVTPREMTVDDIKETQKAFADAALRAKKAGFDGVEIIGSAGYLITQFLSPLKNERTDEYGGSFENRVRFPRELIGMMRKELGPDYPITMRMAGNDFVPGSNTSNETPEIAKAYEDAGIDMINVTGGWHESLVPQLPMTLPRGAFSYLADNIKRAVSIPVMASNRITIPAEAEDILNSGMADMVNLGRVLIADPYWPEKAEQGRENEIRSCVACNQGCSDRLFGVKPVECIFNARAGYEEERNIVKSQSPKNIMVVGSGPGGLEAAVRAAEAGHSVELYEKKSDIGGQLHLAAAPPHKQELLEIIRYYKEMVPGSGIKLHLNSEVDMGMIREKNPDHVILAEGAESLVPPIEGIDDPSVVSSWDVLMGGVSLGQEVAVIGGGAVGLETAHFISLQGTISPETLHFLFTYEAESVEKLRDLVTRGNKDVTVFEMMEKVGKGVGRSTKWILMSDLEKHGVRPLTGVKVLSVRDGVVTFEREGKQESEKFDNVVLAAGSRPVRTLADEIEKTGIPFSVVGDSVRPAQINDAIHGAFMAVMEV